MRRTKSPSTRHRSCNSDEALWWCARRCCRWINDESLLLLASANAPTRAALRCSATTLAGNVGVWRPSATLCRYCRGGSLVRDSAFSGGTSICIRFSRRPSLYASMAFASAMLLYEAGLALSRHRPDALIWGLVGMAAGASGLPMQRDEFLKTATLGRAAGGTLFAAPARADTSAAKPASGCHAT